MSNKMKRVNSKSKLFEVLKRTKGAKFEAVWKHKGRSEIPIVIEFKNDLCWSLLGCVPYVYGITLMTGNYRNNIKNHIRFAEMTVKTSVEEYKIILEFTHISPFRIVVKEGHEYVKGKSANIVIHGRISHDQQKLVCVNLVYAALRNFMSQQPFEKTLHYFTEHPKTRAHTSQELADRYEQRRKIRAQSY